VAEGVYHGALEHAADGMRAFGPVIVLVYRAVVGGSGGNGLTVDGDRIVDEKLDSYGGKASGGGAASTVLGRLGSEEEFGAVDGEASYGVIEVPANGGAKGSFVEGDGGFGIADCEHGGDLSGHRMPHVARS